MKNSKFGKKYGISKKNLRKVFVKLAIDLIDNAEKEILLWVYEVNAEELMHCYIDKWDKFNNEEWAMVLCKAYACGHMKVQEVLRK